MSEDEKKPAPKPQPASPPPRPPRRPNAAIGFGDDDEPDREPHRINLPPKPSAAPVIELPTLPPGVPVSLPASSMPKKRPWWKFW